MIGFVNVIPPLGESWHLSLLPCTSKKLDFVIPTLPFGHCLLRKSDHAAKMDVQQVCPGMRQDS